jgi:hypothetical protein
MRGHKYTIFVLSVSRMVGELLRAVTEFEMDIRPLFA